MWRSVEFCMMLSICIQKGSEGRRQIAAAIVTKYDSFLMYRIELYTLSITQNKMNNELIDGCYVKHCLTFALFKYQGYCCTACHLQYNYMILCWNISFHSPVRTVIHFIDIPDRQSLPDWCQLDIEAEVSDRCLLGVDPRVFVIWDTSLPTR